MIELKNISKTYQAKCGSRVEALKNINFKLEAGQFTALCGSSGCGKSTLLLIAGSMLAADSGQLLLKNEDSSSWSAAQLLEWRRKSVGFLFQKFHLLPYLNVGENMALGLQSEADSQHLLELAEKLQLTHRLQHKPGELSVGEQQRCALLRALAAKPAVLIADEPTGNLDGENTQLVMDCLRDFCAKGGSVLMATHSEDAAAAADSQLKMKQGSFIHD